MHFSELARRPHWSLELGTPTNIQYTNATSGNTGKSVSPGRQGGSGLGSQRRQSSLFRGDCHQVCRPLFYSDFIVLVICSVSPVGHQNCEWLLEFLS